MKTLLKLGILCLSLFFLNSCKDDVPDSGIASRWDKGELPTELFNFFQTRVPAPASFSFPAMSGGTVSAGNFQISFGPESFNSIDGSSYFGQVTLKVRVISNTADMIYSRVTTVSSGELLLSDGMLFIEAYDTNGRKLFIKPGRDARIRTLTPPSGPVNVFKGIDTPDNENTVNWALWDAWMERDSAENVIFGFDTLFQWCNLDRYMNETPLTDLTVYTPEGFTNINTACIIKYTGENSCAYIPGNTDIKGFSTIGGSYKVVVGRACKLLCVSRKGGKYYYQTTEISALAPGQNITIGLMKESSMTEMTQVIKDF